MRFYKATRRLWNHCGVYDCALRLIRDIEELKKRYPDIQIEAKAHQFGGYYFQINFDNAADEAAFVLGESINES